jgi:SAM-dependent methyltransferase
VLAPKDIPKSYLEWNKRHGAPFGRQLRFSVPNRWKGIELRLRGPFSIQPNSLARYFEFPWAYEQMSALPRGSRVLEIGGGLSGLQFVLARQGYQVVNIDPGMEAKGLGWPADIKQHQYLSKIFHAPVTLKPTVIEQAGIPPQFADAVLCVSTLEHLTPEDLEGVTESMKAILKPSGFLVLTMDLFLNLHPFTDQRKNKWGTNVDVRRFIDQSGLKLLRGRPAELYGFPEFKADAILARRHEFISDESGSALAQCLVAVPA